jgi:anthranilate phosphoribosyltransferase
LPEAPTPIAEIEPHQLLDALAARSLDGDESYRAFRGIIAGRFSEVETAAILAALKTRGESPAEIAGAARAMREGAVHFPRPDYAIADTCGTGGDGAGTINVSTAAAFVVAAAGLPVVKHGNRAVSSRCGSADVLEAAGVVIDAEPEVARDCLDEAGVCFLFAPRYHPGMRNAAGVRRSLRTRTVFNVLGPLANPAYPDIQLVGVYAPHLVRPAAETLRQLGCTSALVVHGSGLDEIALHDATTAVRLSNGELQPLVITPEVAGVERHPRVALQPKEGMDPGQWLRLVLAGGGDDAHRTAIAVNAGAVLWISGYASTLATGTTRALHLLRDGEPARRLARLAEVSHGA